MRRTPLTRKTPLRANPAATLAWRQRTAKRLPAIGKKGKEWNAARRDLKPEFQAAGITSCEIGGPGCWRDNGLTFAHTKKRRNIVGGELREVVLACIVCHDAVEILPEKEMTEKLRGIIAARS